MSGTPGDCLNTPEDAADEITAAYEALTLKKLDLQRQITFLTRENDQYRVRYEFLSQKLGDLSNYLGQNARVLSQLCDSSRNALQVARTSYDTPTVVKKRSVGAQNVPPKKALVRHKFHIKPLDLTALQQENVAPKSPILHENLEDPTQDDATLDNCLTTIYEESPQRQSSPNKELYVSVSRLPNSVIEDHLREHDPDTSNNSVDISLGPTFCSTPLKLETMKKLGLVPCSEVKKIHNFVSVREKRNKPLKGSPTKEVAPKLQKRKTTSPKTTDTKKPKLSPEKSKRSNEEPSQVGNSRPHRNAKPKYLKEDNLKSKKRRD